MCKSRQTDNRPHICWGQVARKAIETLVFSNMSAKLLLTTLLLNLEPLFPLFKRGRIFLSFSQRQKSTHFSRVWGNFGSLHNSNFLSSPGPLWLFFETNLHFGPSLTCFLDIVLIAEYPVFCVDCTVFVRKTGANQVGQGGSAQSGGSMGRQSMNRMGTTTVGQLLKGSNWVEKSQ